MVVLSLLHVHPTTAVDDAACTECVQHQCHGHLTQLTTVLHACVLCQFVSLSYVAAAVVVATVLFRLVSQQLCTVAGATVSTRRPGVIVTRGPPVV